MDPEPRLPDGFRFAERIAQIKAERFEDIAVRMAARIEVSDKTIARWIEGGDPANPDGTVPSLADAYHVAERLGVSLDYLTGDDPTPTELVANAARRAEIELADMRGLMEALRGQLALALARVSDEAQMQREVSVAARPRRDRRAK